MLDAHGSISFRGVREEVKHVRTRGGCRSSPRVRTRGFVSLSFLDDEVDQGAETEGYEGYY